MEIKDLHSRVEQSLHSLNNIQRAEANPFLFTRVIEKMKQPAPGIFKPMVIWQFATSMIVVLGLNIAIGLYIFNQPTTSNQSTQTGYFDNHIYTY